jgi:hypothetical protein
MSFVDELNERYFNGELSPSALARLAPVETERQEVQAFVRRAFDQLHRSNIDARNFPETLAWIIAGAIPKVLPGAWGGIVPPITQNGRHTVVDTYLAENPWRPLGPGDQLLDLGCGFPPVTTLETAARFPGARITGADPTFGKYLVIDEHGDYAVFDAESNLLYFQADIRSPVRWGVLHADPQATRRRFSGHLVGRG